uniref:Uncharacterized protein n=1 Tax=Fagus sylvatica TaxID=28930 RepID=A0A2N9I0Q1_FAGSY
MFVLKEDSRKLPCGAGLDCSPPQIPTVNKVEPIVPLPPTVLTEEDDGDNQISDLRKNTVLLSVIKTRRLQGEPQLIRRRVSLENHWQICFLDSFLPLMRERE